MDRQAVWNFEYQNSMHTISFTGKIAENEWQCYMVNMVRATKAYRRKATESAKTMPPIRTAKRPMTKNVVHLDVEQNV